MLTNKIKAQLMLLAIFLLGVVIGAVGLRLFEGRFGGGSSDQTLLTDLDRTLRLSDQQR